MSREVLLDMAGRVNVIDVAGRVIANPVRAMVSRADTVALAIAFEACWAVCLEAELLVRALALPITGNDHKDAARDHAIQEQADRVRNLMATMRPQQQKEQNDGTH